LPAGPERTRRTNVPVSRLETIFATSFWSGFKLFVLGFETLAKIFGQMIDNNAGTWLIDFS
jgi:hypothetical protein